MFLRILKISLLSLMLLGVMGTSCIRSGGVVYKVYHLNYCPPVTFVMPLWIANDDTRVELNYKPIKMCPKFSTFNFYKNAKKGFLQYYATVNKVENDCQLIVGFNAWFQGMAPEAEVSDIKKAYTYKNSVENIDEFAGMLLSNTKLQIIRSGKVEHTDQKTDLTKWCAGKGSFDG